MSTLQLTNKRDDNDVRQFVCFRISDEDYGIEIKYIQDIHQIISITRIPQAPDYVEGVINLRGKIIPVIDLRKRFDLPVQESVRPENRIIVVDTNGIVVGFIVDLVTEVLRISKKFIMEPPDIIRYNPQNQFIDNLVILDEKKILITLNVQRLLSEPEKNDLLSLMNT